MNTLRNVPSTEVQKIARQITQQLEGLSIQEAVSALRLAAFALNFIAVVPPLDNDNIKVVRKEMHRTDKDLAIEI